MRPNVDRESGIYLGGEVNLRNGVDSLLGIGNISISKEDIKAAVLKQAERVASRGDVHSFPSHRNVTIFL